MDSHMLLLYAKIRNSEVSAKEKLIHLWMKNVIKWISKTPISFATWVCIFLSQTYNDKFMNQLITHE